MLNSGTTGSVYDITKWGDDIYISGRFRTASDKICNSVAKYVISEDEFYPLGSGLRYGSNPARVSSLIVYKNELYFGGMFTTAGQNLSASNLAKWTKAPVSVESEIITNKDPVLLVSPNPFSEVFTVSVYLPETEQITIEIYNLKGERIDTIFRGRHEIQNQYSFIHDSIKAGIYFIVLRTATRTYVEQVIQIN